MQHQACNQHAHHHATPPGNSSMQQQHARYLKVKVDHVIDESTCVSETRYRRTDMLKSGFIQCLKQSVIETVLKQ